MSVVLKLRNPIYTQEISGPKRIQLFTCIASCERNMIGLWYRELETLQILGHILLQPHGYGPGILQPHTRNEYTRI